MNIEPLETRIAPAAVFTFTDEDGDRVKITTTLGTNADLAAAATVVGGQLRLLDLTASVFQKTNVTASVLTKGAGGDGLVHIGRIEASGRDLGSVTIAGDLGQIDAGDGVIAPGDALKSLSVRSMGLYGLATQGGAGDLRSDIFGRLGALMISGDLAGASFAIDGGTIDANGPIGSITIGGSLLGGADSESGFIRAAGDIGAVKIGRDFLGGSGPVSGSLSSNGRIASVTIGGSFIGGPGANSGGILSRGALGPVQIGGDFLGSTGASSGKIVTDASLTSLRIGGSLLGGAGPGSGVVQSMVDIGLVTIGGNLQGGGNGTGEINAGGKIASVTISGSLLGGTGPNSGQIVSGGDLGPVKIGFDVKGGTGDESGKIDAGGKLTSVTIGGSLIGGAGRYDTNVVNLITHSGQIFSGGALGLVKIGGDVLGGAGFNSASIFSRGAIAGVQIGGSLLGGSQEDTGVIATLTAAPMGAITIAHDLVGGAGRDSGRISHGGSSAGVTIGGSLLGGTGDGSGSVQASFSAPATAFVKIGHDLAGGTGLSSGFVSGSKVVTIGGSLVGGTGNASGQIIAFGKDIDSIRIGHDFLGGSIAGGGASLTGSGAIESDQRIGSIFIGGSIVSGNDASNSGGLTVNASIRAGRDIGSLTVVGGLIGNATPNGDSPVNISAVGPRPVAGATSDLAIGKISIGGRVECAQIFAGYDTSLTPRNADAQIGAVTVGADWIASSIAAGVQNLGNDFVPGGTGAAADNNFGNLLDFKIQEAVELAGVNSRIASIVIAGQVFGTPASLRPDDSFGFVAEQIGALKVGARSFTLQPGADNDGFAVARRADGLQDDARLHEVGATIGFTPPSGAGAKLVNASTVTYTDADGDRVTAKFSRPLLTTANVNSVFRFDTGLVNDGVLAAQQLRILDLRPLFSDGLGVTFTVVRSAAGDGLVHVGAIESTGVDVGTVNIPGDLGRIDAGGMHVNANETGLDSLTVRTLGRLGPDTQGPQAFVFIPDLQSNIHGRLGALTVRQDVVDAQVNVDSSIGAVTIGGSLIGGGDSDSGRFHATGAIGAVKIGHHLQAGSAEDSGKISTSTGAIASVTIGGSVLGANGIISGRIDSGASLGPVKIGHNIRGGTNSYSGGLGAEGDIPSIVLGGSLLGGRGQYGGGLFAEGAIGFVKIAHNLLGGGEDAGRLVGIGLGSVTIGGSLVGGYDRSGGSILALRSSLTSTDGNIGTVKIGHTVLGGSAQATGIIDASDKLGPVTIGGSLLGGSGPGSGRVESASDTTSVSIGGNLRGGAATGSGVVLAAGRLQAVTLGGSLIGGFDSLAGEISAGGGMGVVKIGRDVHGGSAVSESGSIFARGGNLASISIGGSLFGGAGFDSGEIFSSGSVGVVKIGRDVIGGTISDSGVIRAVGKLTTATIGGSLFGGSGSTSGAIFAAEIGALTIGRNVVGGSIAGSTGTLDQSGYIQTQLHLAALTVGGSIVAGWDTSTGGGLTKNASIRAGNDLGALTVRGSLHGHAASPVAIIARGQAAPGGGPDVALASLTVGGRVERVEMLMGYDLSLAFTNPNAQVGLVKVSGDWVASNLFGAKRIAAIQIAGLVAGTAAGIDGFLIQAAEIGSFKSFGFTAPLTPGPDAPIALSPTTGDVRLVES